MAYKTPDLLIQRLTSETPVDQLKKLSPEEWRKFQWNVNRDINLGSEDDLTEETFPYMSVDDYLNSFDYEQIGGMDGLEHYLAEKDRWIK